MDIAAFLTDRLDEDERVARAATAGPWHVDHETYAERVSAADGVDVVAGGRWGGEAGVFETTEDAIHIARHDPARVLADVTAKREIVAAVMAWGHNQEGDEYYSCAQAAHDGGQPGSACYDDERAGEPCDCGLAVRRMRILGPLARAYVNHPDFDRAWRDQHAVV